MELVAPEIATPPRRQAYVTVGLGFPVVAPNEALSVWPKLGVPVIDTDAIVGAESGKGLDELKVSVPV